MSDQQQLIAMERVLAYRAFRLMKKEGLSKKEANARVMEELDGKFDQDWLALDKTKRPNLEEKNHKFFTDNGIDIASLWITPVMLKKSISDATDAIRFLLKHEGIHDYSTQSQGPEHRIIKKVVYISDSEIKTRNISFYRPLTKQGDPRFWPSKMGDFCTSGDEVGLAIIEKNCVLFNLSQIDYQELFKNTEQLIVKTPQDKAVLNFLTKNQKLSPIANQLLQLIRNLVNKPLSAPAAKSTSKKRRDTDVGMAIENALGIPPNSKKIADYHGIELKAGRKPQRNASKVKGQRHTLFCQVPNWKLSHCTSIKNFVQLVGYPIRDQEELKKIPKDKQADAKELRCTVSSKTTNSQGLRIKINNDTVIEFIEQDPNTDLLVWEGTNLRERLAEKHPETFWITCRPELDVNRKEIFYVEKIIYTRKPMVAQFLSTIEEGVVTLDHMIGYRNGTISERGPAFKIFESDLSKIFPENIEIDLLKS